MDTDGSARPLLAVKQQVPPVRDGAVVRGRLVEQVASARTRLVVVVAPAGWGKTSLLSAWARDGGDTQRVAWVSLDESDDEPRRFWRYVLTALSELGDDLSTAPLEALAAEIPVVELALPVLLNELAASRPSHVLVLDDYHVITDPEIHESLEFLLTYLPSSLRIVLASRADPALPLARLRARGDLTEIRAAQLRFSPDEAADLVSTVSGLALDSARAEVVWQQTEGWAAGLQLAGLALRADPDRSYDDRHLFDYFAAEVLPGLAPRQRDLLVRSAPLELLSGDLCDAALQVEGSAEVLAELVRADLFVAALDHDREWYRCHALLRDALLHQRGADPDGVLQRAAWWFAGEDRIDEAVHHLLRAGQPGAAGELLLAHAERWFLARGEAATFVQLGERLPLADVDPSLAYALAYAAALCGDRDRVVRWLDACEDRASPDAVAPGWHSFEAAVLSLRANFGVVDADSGRAVALAQRGYELETQGGREGHPVASWGLGASLARDGRFDDSAAVLLDLWRGAAKESWPPWLLLSVAGTLVITLVEAGRGDDCDAVLRQSEPLAKAAELRAGRGITPGLSALRLAAGRRRHQTGQVDTAAPVLRHAVELIALHPRPTLLVLALVYLADAELACGERSAAQAALTRAREVADDEPVSQFVLPRLETAELRIGRGAVRAARRSGVLVDELTDRELSVLRAMQGTASQREIGQALFLSINTVKAYNKSLYRKLGVGSRQEAVATARELGLI